MILFYEDVVVGEFMTSKSREVEYYLDLIDFDEEAFKQEHGMDDLDPNDFNMLSSWSTSAVNTFITDYTKGFYEDVLDGVGSTPKNVDELFAFIKELDRKSGRLN